jgi:Fe-S-cluster containining protein
MEMRYNKEWSCDMSCGFNCCSNLFLLIKKFGKLSHKETDLLLRENKIRALKFLTEYHLLSFRNELEIKDLGMMYYEIKINTEWKFHEYDGRTYLEINSPCNKLIGNKCAIYKNRPEACKVNKCVIKDPELFHFNLKFGVPNKRFLKSKKVKIKLR